MQAKTNAVIAVILGLTLAACAPRPSIKSGDTSGAAGNGPTAEASKSEPDVRGTTMVAIPEVQTVHFDYDSAMLRSEARTTLKANARWLKQHQDVKVQVAGNCDERGTVEYNLALGQRRAASVRAYYVSLGVSARRIATISYGKERPLCQESNEQCWSQNRRAETLRAAPDSASTK